MPLCGGLTPSLSPVMNETEEERPNSRRGTEWEEGRDRLRYVIIDPIGSANRKIHGTRPLHLRLSTKQGDRWYHKPGRSFSEIETPTSLIDRRPPLPLVPTLTFKTISTVKTPVKA